LKTVSGLDGTFLHIETPDTPQHVGSLSRYALPPGYKGDFYDNFRREMAKRLDLVPVFTRKLAPMPLQFANPVWVEDDQVDLDYHVQRLPCAAPAPRRSSKTASAGCIRNCSTATAHYGASP